MEDIPQAGGPTMLEKVKGLLHFGFVPPPFDGMQVYSRMKFLFDSVVKHATRSTGVALEIGCYKGCSTVFLAKGCLKRGIDKIFSVDLFTGSPTWGQTIDTEAEAQERLRRFGLSGAVTLIRGDSKTAPWTKSVDVLHIDGDHEYEAVSADIKRFAPYVVPGGIIVVDDYDEDHPGVRRAVDELVLKREVKIAATHSPGRHSGSICLVKVRSEALVTS